MPSAKPHTEQYCQRRLDSSLRKRSLSFSLMNVDRPKCRFAVLFIKLSACGQMNVCHKNPNANN